MAKRSSVAGRAAASREGPGLGGQATLDPRVLVSRERVLITTLDLLMETGLGELTMDEVSRRSGVAKTTIYRHWANRSALVIDACSRMTDGQEAPPDTGSLEGDLRAILADIAGLLGAARWSSILPSIVDAAERDPEFAGLHSRIQHGHAAPLRAALDRAALRGEIPPAADRSAIAAALLGPLFYRRWFSREQIDAEFVEMIIRSAIAGLHQDPATRSVSGPQLSAGLEHVRAC
ncbi:MAG: TetR/AcrR family transcriptional regulator [Actinomycetota bacterium]|nr:TetR/AcrR family transcriptional regulator [Actinomycetota bacterium]